jgi:hypothetical protein
VPSNTYGAAGAAGSWNALDGTPGANISGLIDTAGNVSGASVTITGGSGNFSFNNVATTGDDEALMDDLQDVGAPPGVATLDFAGLFNGTYTVRTYAWAPDDRINLTTTVTVTGGMGGAQTLGGAWTGSHVAGSTYAQHTVDVSDGTLQVQAAAALGFGSLNGIQLEPAALGVGVLAISEICDGTLTGGQPKWVELSNVGTATIPDLSAFSIGNFNNGAGALGFDATPLNAVPLAAGASYIFAYESSGNTNCDPNGLVTCFEFAYGFPADQYAGAFTNGDDAVALFNGVGLAGATATDPSLFDVYGEIGCDPNASGTPCPEWEYTDSFAVRCATGPAATFSAADWIIAGANALESSGSCDELCLLQTLTSPGSHAGCGPTAYCTAKTGFCGPGSISASGTPSASATSGFVIQAGPALDNRAGIFMYSSQGRGNVPFSGGTLCLGTPGVLRSPAVNSGGAPFPTGPACDGVFSIDWNAFAQGMAGGNPAAFLKTIGQQVNVQVWGRDTVNTGPYLSNALEYLVGM